MYITIGITTRCSFLKTSFLIGNEILRMATKHVVHFLQRSARGALLPNEKYQRMKKRKNLPQWNHHIKIISRPINRQLQQGKIELLFP
jgi:hypothetical protein